MNKKVHRLHLLILLTFLPVALKADPFSYNRDTMPPAWVCQDSSFYTSKHHRMKKDIKKRHAALKTKVEQLPFLQRVAIGYAIQGVVLVALGTILPL